MQSSKESLLAVLEDIKDKHVLVVGDIMLDRYVWGDADRVSPEAPVLIVDVNKKDERMGGAGNVVANLLNLGVKVSLCGVVGDDYYGNKIISRLEDLGVDATGVIKDKDRPTSTKKRVIASNQQIVRIDNEDRTAISESVQDEMISAMASKIDDVSAVIVSDYGKGAYTKKLSEYFSNNADKISLKKCPIIVDPKPNNKLLYKGASIIKPNRKEAEEMTGVDIVDNESAIKAGRIIKKELGVELVLMSLGSKGLMILSEEHPEGLYSDTLARKVFDVSGAGDTVVSAFTSAYISSRDELLSGDLANICAAVVVSEVGTAPVDYNSLLEEIDNICQK